MKNLVFIIYDSIFNSVFQSQVLTPLLERLKENPNLKIHLISFEKKIPTQQEIEKIIPHRPTFALSLSKGLTERQFIDKNLHVILESRLPFFGKLSFLEILLRLIPFIAKSFIKFL